MSRYSPKRRRRSVELGPLIEPLLIDIACHEDPEQLLGLRGVKINESFILRLALLRLHQSLFPGRESERIRPQDIEGQDTGGRPRRCRKL